MSSSGWSPTPSWPSGRSAPPSRDRVGPNRTGLPLGGVRIGSFTIPTVSLWGLGQPLADALKFMFKEEFTPRPREQILLLARARAGHGPGAPHHLRHPVREQPSGRPSLLRLHHARAGRDRDVGIGVLLVFAIASLGVYGIVLAGWASNSKYPFLGGIRSSAQMISYEVSMGLSVIPLFLVMGNLRLSDVVAYQAEHGWTVLPFLAPAWPWNNGLSYLLWIPMLVSFLVFLVSAFAETNRLPLICRRARPSWSAATTPNIRP